MTVVFECLCTSYILLYWILLCHCPDFDAVSEHTSRVPSSMLKERVRVGRSRPRKAPSTEHLRKISLGDIGDELPSVQLRVLEDDEVRTRKGAKGTTEAVGVVRI